jgi:hypothetical protein
MSLRLWQEQLPDRAGAIWNGIAGAAKFQFNSVFAISPRIEWFNVEVVSLIGGNPKGQHYDEFTVTFEARASQGILARLEYRYDWSDQPFYPTGLTGISDHQSTLSLGMIAFFGPKR